MKKTKRNIHLLIDELDIPKKVKHYFDKLEFYEIIEDPIVLIDDSRDISDARKNCWSFSVNLKYCNKTDIASDFLLTAKRDAAAPFRFFRKAFRHHSEPRCGDYR